MGGGSLQTIGEFPGHFPLCFDGSVLYSAKESGIYRWKDLESPSPERVGTLPRDPVAKALGRVRSMTRMFRLGISHLIVARGRSVAVAEKSVYVSHESLDRWRPIGSLSRGRALAPGGRPMRFGVDARDGEALIGEYRSNPARSDVTLFAVAGEELTERWTFPAGSVRHIHAVQSDPYSQDTWVATGDYGRECRILRSRDGMRTAELIGCGDQTWRTASFVFDEHAIYWGMDSPLERCFVFRLERTGYERVVIGELPGPIWHASSNRSGWLAFATGVEPSHRYREPYAYLYAGRSSGLHEVARFQKDRMSMRWFQPGLISFPIGTAPSDMLVFTGTGLVGIDDTMVIARLTS